MFAEAASETLSGIGLRQTTACARLRRIPSSRMAFCTIIFVTAVYLILCSVRVVVARCVDLLRSGHRRRSDPRRPDDGLSCGACADDVNEAHTHRLWYDIRSQCCSKRRSAPSSPNSTKSLEDTHLAYHAGFAGIDRRTVVDAAIDDLRDDRRVVSAVPSKHLSGDPHALDQMQADVRLVISKITHFLGAAGLSLGAIRPDQSTDKRKQTCRRYRIELAGAWSDKA